MKNLEINSSRNHKELSDRLADIDMEFKDFLAELAFEKPLREQQLTTFSPMDAVQDFEHHGFLAVPEVSTMKR
ncbi:MAG: hypothetical protein H7A33_06580 [Deltaproteobacteria bacterium]|nr:hypothetical protein [Deltaproteobacteria bacterium]